MAETTSKEAEAGVIMSAEQIDTLLGNNAVVMNDVQVIGLELLSPKFISIINHLLTRQPWGITYLVFSAEYPEDKYGMFSTARELIVINVAQHWNSAVKLIEHNEHFLSLRGHLWHNMLLSLFHELVHAKSHAEFPEQHAKMTVEEKDDMAEEVAAEELEELVKHFDIEPASMSEEPFFGTRYMQLYIDAISNGKETWQVRQNEMHDEKHVYLDESGSVLIESFRDYTRGIFDGKRKDKTWETEVQQLATFTLPAVVAQPITNDIVVVDEQGVATVATEATMMAEEAQRKNTRDLEGQQAVVVVDELVEPVGVGQHGWEDEALIHLLGEEHVASAVDVDPSFTTHHAGPTAAPPTTAAPAGAFCAKCGDPIIAANAFCSKCGNPTTAAAAPTSDAGAPWKTTAPAVESTYNAGVAPHSAWQTAYDSPQQAHVQNRRIEKLDTGLPPHNLTGEQITAILREVYMRLYNFCFDKCGWQMPLGANVLQDQTGTLCRDGFNRDVRDAVLGGISVADIPGVNQLIYAYRSIDANGQYAKIPADGMIRGWVAKEAKIPMFNLYLNVNAPGGEAAKRVFIPQNPYKVKNGKYSDTAMQAQGGAKIAYVINGDDRVPDNDPRKYVADIKGGYLNFK